MKAFNILPTEEEEERLEALRAQEPTAKEQAGKPLALYWHPLLWAGALLPRLLTLFFLTNPENAGDGWHGDVYHHWQIAYLTKQIGLFAPGGPRLWDLKGLDYFWGILHPLLLVFLFFVTGSIDIILARLLSLTFGALVVVLIFHLCRRHWGTRVAIAATLFAALAPTSVFVDSTGFLEPMGVGLCLLGIWLWPKRGVWTGVSWALAAMARAEAWILSLGLVVTSFLRHQTRNQRLAMVFAWAAGILLYMKILLDKTGNPIYPVYWNFLANAVGQWEFRVGLSPTQQAIQPVLGALLLLSEAGLGLTLWKRPKAYMFLTFGFGYLVFTFGFLGFTAYIKSWESWFWMERFFVFPYEFAAVLVSIGLFVLVPRYLGGPVFKPAWLIVGALLAAVQLEWPPILDRYGDTQPIWRDTMAAGQYIGALYSRPEYRGTTLNVPPANPSLTYVLARFDGVDGKYILGQLYDPFYYLPATYTYAEHPQVAGVLLQCWLARSETRLWLIEPRRADYLSFVGEHPAWFRRVGTIPEYEWAVEDVQVPPPTPLECDQAARNARA